MSSYEDVFEMEDGHNSGDAIDNIPFVISTLAMSRLKKLFLAAALEIVKKERREKKKCHFIVPLHITEIMV